MYLLQINILGTSIIDVLLSKRIYFKAQGHNLEIII